MFANLLNKTKVTQSQRLSKIEVQESKTLQMKHKK